MTTRSKLGGIYPTSMIQDMDKEAHRTLKALRALPDERQTVYRGISDLPRLESYTQV